MANATSAAARPRLIALGASFGVRLFDAFLGAAFFFAAMGVSFVGHAEDDARAALVGEIGPGPVDEHDEAAAESDQEIYMQQQPEPPGEKARELQVRQLCDGGMTPDGG